MGGRVVEGARLESVFRLNRLTWVRIPPYPPLKALIFESFFLWRESGGDEESTLCGFGGPRGRDVEQ